MSYLTITQVSEKLAAANGWHDDTKSKAHRTIRNLVTKGLIAPVTTLDGRDSIGLDPDDIFTIRLYLALNAVGFEIDDLRIFDRAINPPADHVEEGRAPDGTRDSRPVWKSAADEESRISNVVASTRNGVDWEFRCTVSRDSGGNRVVNAAFWPKTAHRTPDEEAALRRFREFQQFTVEAEIVIPASDLFRPLLEG